MRVFGGFQARPLSRYSPNTPRDSECVEDDVTGKASIQGDLLRLFQNRQFGRGSEECTRVRGGGGTRLEERRIVGTVGMRLGWQSLDFCTSTDW